MIRCCWRKRQESKLSSQSLLALMILVLVHVSLIDADASPPIQKGNSTTSEALFRPVQGEFPPIELAHTYRGELVFVDHANRRGSLRVQGSGMFFRNDPHPFALLPYAVVRYRNAPADLRDIPLGTILRVHAFLPPDPTLSAVPVLPPNNKEKDANHNRGAGIFPAENHVLLLEDEASYCKRTGNRWYLTEIKLNGDHGTVKAIRAREENGVEGNHEETFSIDSSTRIYRSRELLTLDEWLNESDWKQDTPIALENFPIDLGIIWKPTSKDLFTHFHLSEIWLDEVALQRASHQQKERHIHWTKARWMPGWVDAVDYGEFGEATVTATLFGGMAEELYRDFKIEDGAMMNPVEVTLKHTHGAYGPAHMACRGPIIKVIRSEKSPPLGSSGIQIQFKTDLVLEGVRPSKIIRVRPPSWPIVNLPREEYLNDGSSTSEERFPTPDIFPKYR